jgi:glucuronate isomerase
VTPLIQDNFLLQSATARRLYHDVAAKLPLIDYHNHLDARGLADDRRFADLTELWIASDPYKHRAMRIAGVPERDITGDVSPRTKFDRWAAVVPQTLGSPLYHWSALELKRYFDIDEPLTRASADRIWSRANERLASPQGSARSLLERANVAVVCTSDLATDDLSHHGTLGRSGVSTRVLPSLRVDGLCGTAGAFDAILKRLDAFDAAGCLLADHSLDVVAYDASTDDADRFRTLAREYARRGWTLQLHLGAQRQTSTRLRSRVGPAGGYATAGAPTDIASLCRLLDDLEQAGALPRVILYPLNPADYAPLAILTGSFAEDGVRGKIQLGPAWWFNDHLQGIKQHLSTLANYGLLSTFIGMTTDSRSLLSMVRHEYFRRIVCDWLGEQVAAGAMPDDSDLLAALVRAICHDNAADMLNLGERNG